MKFNCFLALLTCFVGVSLLANQIDLTDMSDFETVTEKQKELEAVDKHLKDAESKKKEAEDTTFSENSVVQIMKEGQDFLENVGSEEALDFLNLKASDWNQTTRLEAIQLIKKIPTHIRYKFLGRLTRLLLLASLEVPLEKEKKGSLEKEVSEDLSFLTLRAQKLYDMGFLSDAFRLMEAHRILQSHPLYQKLKFEHDLMHKEVLPACDSALTNLKKTNSLYWQKAQATCQILQGKIDSARLSFQIIAEDQGQKEKDFISAIQLYFEPELAKYTPQKDAPDMLGLILVSKLPGGLNEEKIAGFPLLVRQYLEANMSEDLHLSDVAKLELYEEALDMFFIEPSQLKQEYIKFYKTYKQKRGGEALDFKDIASSLTPESRAIMYGYSLDVADQNETVDMVRLALLANAYKSKRLRPVSRVLGGDLRGLEPREGSAKYVDLIALAAAYSDDAQSICPWQFYARAATHLQTLPFIFIQCQKTNKGHRNAELEEWFDHFQERNKDHPEAFYRYAATFFLS